MNSFFEYYFSNVDFDGKETAVCCPFPHQTTNGIDYFETNPSAHINLMKEVFHCKVCGEGLSETGFISKVLGCKYETAEKIKSLFKKRGDKYLWEQTKSITDERRQKANALGIRNEVLDILNIATEFGDDLAFPVFMYGKLLDVRSYRPDDRQHKIKSRTGAISGLVIPFDEWVDTPNTRWTILCAGEKDMAVTRSHHLNAITLTGGERSLPAFINPFKDRKIAICYDNDTAGIEGAKSLAAYLQPYAAQVRVVTGFHEVCQERGEDLTDFFVKYKKGREDLIKYINETPDFTAEEAKEETRHRYPLVTLMEATSPQYMGRMVQSNVQVVATFDKTFPVPTTMKATKISNANGDVRNNILQVGDTKTWSLNENTCQDILKLIDNNFTEEQIRINTREILGIPKLERDIKVEKPTKESVFICSLTDMFDMTTEDISTTEYVAYSIHKKLESGKKYLITYKLAPHPFKGQTNTIIITDAEDASDSVTNFKVTADVKADLDLFKNMEGTVPEKIEQLTEMAKSFIGYNGYNQLIQAIDLSFHTVLEFNFNRFNNVRGYLDTLIVTESRVGKSSTAQELQRLYGLGAFASLAGNSATIPGLVGGSNKVNGSFQTRAGLIPMNHRGLIIFEELAKCNVNLIKELTDIRSSNKIRISRVSGTVDLPALVRMITLTNTRNTSSKSRPINSYPFGIDVLMELIGSPEDIARYDIALVMGESGAKNIDPDYVPVDAFDREAYRTRVRWIWSRTVDQVIISNDMVKYIIEQCNELNNMYECHIKLFGTEAWKKVTRLALAVAGYLVSTDATYENIILTKEHVDWAISYLKSIYDNETFKLREFVANERMYTEIDDDGVALLQEIYNKFTSGLLQLEKATVVSKQILMAATGLDNDSYNKMMQRLTKGLFVQFDGFDIVPTPRFRKGMGKINRDVNISRVGEADA